MRKLLWPLSWVYGVAVYLRNMGFGLGLLKQVDFPVPVVVIGNLSAGGTGKSPLVQLLAGALSKEFKVAILSRGYGRSTKGFRMVSKGDAARQSGDEPLQYVHTLENVIVAVCEDRVEGIRRLLAEGSPPDVILLDDAFQHRYVKPGYAILLTEFSKPYYSDSLLPSGNLREPAAGAKRADAIVVTKCPPQVTVQERQKIREELKPLQHQQIYFSYIHYRDPLQRPDGSHVPLEILNQSKVMLLCGIANPQGLTDFVSSKAIAVETCVFPDHHPYSVGDIIKLKNRFMSFASSHTGQSFLLTTRKDYMRLLNPELQHLLKELPLLILDIEPAFFQSDQMSLHDTVRNYIMGFRKNH